MPQHTEEFQLEKILSDHTKVINQHHTISGLFYHDPEQRKYIVNGDYWKMSGELTPETNHLAIWSVILMDPGPIHRSHVRRLCRDSRLEYLEDP